MPLVNIVKVCETHLFSDVAKMEAAKVPQITQQRILRIRQIYDMWLQTPSKREGELAQMIMAKYNVSRSEAYSDVKLTKQFLGNVAESSKQFHRWRFNNMMLKVIETAERRNDLKALVAALDKYAKFNQLDKADELENNFEDVAVQPFEPTDNPEIIGIKRIPNIKQRINQKLKQYMNDDIVDIQFEEADFSADKFYEK